MASASQPTSTMTTRSKQKESIFLLESTQHSLTGAKLPSTKMVFCLFLHKHLEVKMTVHDSATQTIEELMTFWDKARIPTQDKQHCILKLEKCFKKWKSLKKNKNRQTDTQRNNEQSFLKDIDQLFDIAHANAMELMTNEEDREFLKLQREGRQGTMSGVDKKLDWKEKRIKKRNSMKEEQKRKTSEEMNELDSTVTFESTDEDEKEESSPGTSEEACKKPKKQYGKECMFSPGLMAALDRTNLSDRKATFVLAETASSIGHDVGNIALSRSTLQRKRKKMRIEQAEDLKQAFSGSCPLVVHWDGKLMSNLEGSGQIDRLPVCVSGENIAQILVVAKLENGTGEAQAKAVCEAIEDWGLTDRVCAMSFDTTSSNTGKEKGACVLIERRIGKSLLKLACRHHIMELVIGAVFKINSSVTSAPHVPLFKKFKEQWPGLRKKDYETAVMDKEMKLAVADIQESTIEFAKKYLQEVQPRDDYREFLQLSLIFLGDESQGETSFRAPGAMHHARWMSKVLYSLKIWMFRSQFKLTCSEERGLRQVCIFAVRIYLKAWMQAPLAAHAPMHDLSLMKELSTYRAIDPRSADAAFMKMKKHTWYLQPELACLGLFDDHVDLKTKREMVEKLRGPDCFPMDLKLTQEEIMSKQLPDFVSPKSTYLFSALRIEDNEFLGHDPAHWPKIDAYTEAQKRVHGLKVVNDMAERGVALAQEFNRKLTKDEVQLQAIFRVVAEHRKRYPNCRKKTLLQ